MELPWAPGRLPVIGHMYAYASEPLRFLERSSRLGPLVRMEFPWMDSVLVNDPELIEQVLVTESKSFRKDRYLRDLRRALGEGLLTSEGEFWLRQRRLAQPAFHKERIAEYGKTMVECAEREVRRWKDGEERDVHADMMRVTLEIVGKTLFGADVSDRAAEVAHGLEGLMERYGDPIAMGVPDWEKLPTPLNKRVDKAIRDLDRVARDMIAERKKAGPGRDLLSTFLEARDDDGTGMTDQQLRDEVLTLFLAGHETTAINLSWTWMLLAQNPDVRRKLHAEIDALQGRSPTVADLPRLPYAERVIKESMRLWPPAWSIGREAITDVQIGPLHVTKGTNLWIAQWSMHRDARYFDDPERFDPDRWSGDLQKRIPKYAYFPFGGGPRLCIGNAFAMMEAVLMLVTFAQKFEMELVPGHPLVGIPSITLRPKHGIRVRLSRRADARARASDQP